MDDGDSMLAHWTKKIMNEEGHALPQMLHIVWLVVKHQKIFFRVRNSVTTMMLAAMNRLLFSSSISLDNKRQAVDLAEVFIQWQKELRSAEPSKQPIVSESAVVTSPEDETDRQKIAEAVINFLMRMATSLHDASNTNTLQSEMCVKRCLNLLESAFSVHVWGSESSKYEIKITWMDKVLMTSEQSNANGPNLLSSVQLLEFCLKFLVCCMS